MQLTIEKPGVPAGVYTAKYQGGEELTTSFGDAYKLKFKVVGGEFDGKETSRLVNLGATSPKSNIVKFFAALAGVEPKEGVHINDADFVGARYEIVVEAHGTEGFTKIGQIVRRLPDDESPKSDNEPSAGELFGR